MVLAAGFSGFQVELTMLADGDSGPIADATFIKGGTKDSLAEQILKRHSNKEAYSDKRLTTEQFATLSNYATLYIEEGEVAPIREMTKRAFQIETNTPHTLKESVDLMRIGKSEINANPDGIEMSDPMLEALRLMGLLDETVLMDLEHPGNKAHVEGYLAMLDATPHYAVLTTSSNRRLDQLETGRRLMRLYLKTTEMGIGLHPVSQALQEYPEMTDEYQLAHQLLATDGETVQMLMRLGFGPEPVATPRWPLESRIINEV